MPAAPPALFDAHLHPEGLSDADLETMRLFGVEAALACAHHATREPTAKSIREHFDDLVGRQLRRLEAAGIRAYAALGVHPQRIPRRGVGEVLAALPDYFGSGKVIALGEIGLHGGGPIEESCFQEQLALAERLCLRVLVHTPHREKDVITKRILNLLRATPLAPERVLVDHASAKTVRPILAMGFSAGLTVHPDELTAERAVALVRKIGSERLLFDSDSGDGAGDILGVARAAHLLQKAELSAAVTTRVLESNARRFFGLAGG